MSFLFICPVTLHVSINLLSFRLRVGIDDCHSSATNPCNRCYNWGYWIWSGHWYQSSGSCNYTCHTCPSFLNDSFCTSTSCMEWKSVNEHWRWFETYLGHSAGFEDQRRKRAIRLRPILKPLTELSSSWIKNDFWCFFRNVLVFYLKKKGKISSCLWSWLFSREFW
jgi:hypothetical protein